MVKATISQSIRVNRVHSRPSLRGIGPRGTRIG
jgi:hypothetical protein